MRSGTAEGNRARGTRGGGKQRRWKTENPVLRLPACLLARPCPQSRERSQSRERTRPEPGGNGWVGTTQELGYDALDGGGCGRERNDAQLETRAETAKRWVRSKDDRGSEEPGAAMVWTTAPCEACGNRGAGGDFWGGQEDWGKETPASEGAGRAAAERLLPAGPFGGAPARASRRPLSPLQSALPSPPVDQVLSYIVCSSIHIPLSSRLRHSFLQNSRTPAFSMDK
ncbi:hypothetical protein M432DRAFT_591330 [Thermoascus aurantiacus ATCC 26904]